MGKSKAGAKAIESTGAREAAKTDGAPASVAGVLGGLTKERIAQVDHAETRAALTAAQAIASGIADAHLGKLKTDSPGIATTIEGNGITVPVAKTIVASALGVIAAFEAQETKRAAYHAAVEETKALTAALDKDVSKKSQLLRGSLGAQSATLKSFGVKTLGGARKKKSSTAGSKKAPKAAPPAPKS